MIYPTHPSTLYLERIIGNKISEISKGPMGYTISLDNKAECVPATRPNFRLIVECEFHISENSEHEINKWKSFDSVNSDLKVYNGIELISYNLREFDCQLILEFSKNIKFKLTPSTQEIDYPWGIFDYHQKMAFTMTIYSDYFLGYWGWCKRAGHRKDV